MAKKNGKKTFFSDEMLRELPVDDEQAVLELRKEFSRFMFPFEMAKHKPDSLESSLTPAESELDRIHTIINAFAEARSIHLKIAPGPSKDGIEQLLEQMQNSIDEREQRIKKDKEREKYANIFQKGEVYEFDDDDFTKLQALINELRQTILKTEALSADHKRRLLRRLEAMQAELHKTTTDIDRFWGFIAEAGIVTKKFGKDVEPITKNVEKLSHIVLKAVVTIEGVKHLPEAVTKLLGY